MPSVFTRVIAGDLPARFVWRDPHVVAFLTKNPLRPGHVLVVPRREVDHWIDLDAGLSARVFEVARSVGRALARAFPSRKVGVLIGGLEVPHVHVHVVPIDDVHDLDFDRQDRDPSPSELDDDARRIREALAALGHAEASA